MTPQTDREIADYFNAQETAAINEMEILGTVVAEILQAGQPITNKAIIARLIQRLELESDVVMLDIYRHVLELVVHKTEDDILS
ncbi:MAG: biofilm/acid-resistance regulator YmgB/AriR [Mixta calida]|nr:MULTISPECIES: biofilm/acid-resistance regulator YmgB/AriR [Mixta]MDU3815133.1 biofilm/acid-resistance regulator YmgB/AriR [Pantoea sp.]MCR1567687.1 biofilm development regulator YmgB/AriR family protein [Mixta sp.]MDU3077376.1 biofilm/acid-resistance regulator YmgB/AriR [Mixta calida]MDU4288028.1 biofilm/acid-resistance regulator YmgB/AriR [Mixta calida]MDU4939994.1 biofilm/acid-resistance regulator YmgB/AriR [Mixta calida]